MFGSSPEKKIEKLEKKRDKLKLRLTLIGLKILELQLETDPQQPESESQPLQPPAETSLEIDEHIKKILTSLKDDLDKLAQFDIDIDRAKDQMKMARNFMKSGNYEKTLDFLQRTRVLANIEARKIRVRGPKYKRPRVRDKCPSCGEKVETGWKRCPMCKSQLAKSD